MEENTKNTSTEKSEKKTEVPKKQQKKSDPNADFKRKYFDYYDDVKISDRQDW